MQLRRTLNQDIANIKQLLRFPSEFRFPFSEYTYFTAQEPQQYEDNSVLPTRMIGATDEQLFDMVADIGTQIWRAQRRLCTLPKESKEHNKLSRDLESSVTALKQLGFEIKDFVGQDYVTGMAVNVIASQTKETLKKDLIIETFKPTIYYNGKIIQRGDVVIGIPKENG